MQRKVLIVSWSVSRCMELARKLRQKEWRVTSAVGWDCAGAALTQGSEDVVLVDRGPGRVTTLRDIHRLLPPQDPTLPCVILSDGDTGYRQRLSASLEGMPVLRRSPLPIDLLHMALRKAIDQRLHMEGARAVPDLA